MASARSTATIEVRTTRPGADQGITRLAMLAFMSSKPGPWNGSPGTGEWVRYRGHIVTRMLNDGNEVLVTLGMLYTGHDGNNAAYQATVSPGGVITRLRDLDDLLDAIVDVWPLEDEGEPVYTTAEGTTIGDVLTAGALVERLEGILRHVHDLVKRGASLDEIDAGLHAARSANERITPADRGRAEVDLEVDGKTIARADEWPLADDGSDLTGRERNGDDR